MHAFVGRIIFLTMFVPSSTETINPLRDKIIFLRIFVSSFTKTINPLQDMWNNNIYYKWGPKEKESFIKMKEEIAKAPTLMSRCFCKDFILYTFSYIACAEVLTQKMMKRTNYGLLSWVFGCKEQNVIIQK